MPTCTPGTSGTRSGSSISAASSRSSASGRSPDISGYHYWLIVDFPGGTGEGDSWEEGWFDYFWQPKNITPRDGLAINGAVVPLITTRVGDRSLWSDTARRVDVLVSNYGSTPLKDAVLTWKLVADGTPVETGTARATMAMGAVGPVAQIALGTHPDAGARKLELMVDIDGAHANSWSFWSFPRGGRLDRAAVPVHSTVKWAGIQRLYPFVQQDAPKPGTDALLVTSVLDEPALNHLRAGGRVWLMAEQGRTQARQEVAFFPAAGGALGTVIGDHRALRGFPHEGFGDLQLFNLMDGAAPIPLDKWPTGFQPIIGGIRTTAGFLSKSKDLSRVGYAFEAKVGARAPARHEPAVPRALRRGLPGGHLLVRSLVALCGGKRLHADRGSRGGCAPGADATQPVVPPATARPAASRRPVVGGPTSRSIHRRPESRRL